MPLDKRADMILAQGQALTFLRLPPATSPHRISGSVCRKGRPLANLLPAPVESYILREGLYREDSDVLESKARALAVASAILDKKATDVLILHIASLTSLADYLVIGSGESERQARAIADHVSDSLSAQGHAPLSTEGASSAKWVVMDFW